MLKPVNMFVRLIEVEDIVLSYPDQKVARCNILQMRFLQILSDIAAVLLLHLDAVGRGDDPPVGDERSPALVFELAALVLPQAHLPGPLGVAGHVTAHNPPLN